MVDKLQKTDHFGSNETPFRVGVLPVPGFALMSYACTVEPLRAANLLSQKHLYEVMHIGHEPRVLSSGGASVPELVSVEEDPEFDLIIVIAGGDPFAFDDQLVLSWLKKVARRGVRIGGVSGGPVVLVKAGVMEGRRMAVHWEHSALLEEQFEKVVLERRLFVIDRDRVTCGGGIAPLDMMHALISEHHGSIFAQLVSDWFLHTDIRAASAPQRGDTALRVSGASSHMVEAVATMESHIGDPLNLQQLSLIAGVSPRQLNRIFYNSLGVSVMAHYRALRLAVGRRMVRQSAMKIEDIAEATGFANPGHFSNAYKTEFGIRPRQDRGG